MSLARFHEAQAQPLGWLRHRARGDSPGSARALACWRTRPAFADLKDRFGEAPKPAREARALPSRSPPPRAYAIRDLAEASEYLRDPLLRARYEEITAAVSDQLARGLMGRRIDALKLVSSLTLFCAAVLSLVNEKATFESLAQRCDSVLGQTSTGRYLACEQAIGRLGP